jgi:hypothetical protein
MKKLGTPSGAGPGTEKEKVGLAAVGTPLLLVGAGGFGVVVGLVFVLGPVGPVGFLPPLGPVGPLGPLPCEPFGLPLFPPEPLGLPGEDEVPVGPVGAEPDEPDEPLAPVEGTGLVDVELGLQEADTFFTGPTPAGTIEAAGVPGGTLTLKVSVCPVSSVTVTEHWSAEAVGRAAIPKTANTDAADPAAIFSFRGIDN